MSHEFETGFFLHDPAWHGLGTVLDTPPSIEEALRLSGLDWTVRVEKTFLSDGREAIGQATVRESDNSILGHVGPDYSVLQNKEAFDWFEPLVSDGSVVLDAAGSLRNGKRVWVLGRIGKDPIEIVKGDPVLSYILLANSHDGTLAARCGFTPVRVVCANTLAAALDSAAGKLIKVTHRGDMKGTLEKIRDIMDLARREFVATTEQYQALASRQVSRDDLEKYVRKVFKVTPPKHALLKAELTGKPIRENQNYQLLGRIVPLFEHGRGNDMPGVKGTWWGAYNAVSEFLTHERGREQETRVDSLWFGQGAALNRKALNIALEMSDPTTAEAA